MKIRLFRWKHENETRNLSIWFIPEVTSNFQHSQHALSHLLFFFGESGCSRDDTSFRGIPTGSMLVTRDLVPYFPPFPRKGQGSGKSTAFCCPVHCTHPNFGQGVVTPPKYLFILLTWRFYPYITPALHKHAITWCATSCILWKLFMYKKGMDRYWAPLSRTGKET